MQEEQSIENSIQNLDLNKKEFVILQGVDNKIREISDIIKLSLGKNDVFHKSGF